MKFPQNKKSRYEAEQCIKNMQHQNIAISYLKTKLEKLKGIRKEIDTEEVKINELEKLKNSFVILQQGISSLKNKEELSLFILQEQKQLLNKGFLDS